MKYLLSQSDIFSHFGGHSSDSKSADKEVKSAFGSKRRSAAAEELDDDERAMAKEIGDGDNEDEMTVAIETRVLLRQPSCISGGDMR